MASGFNGVNQYLTFADLAAHDMTAAGAFTVAAVVKADTIGTNSHIVMAHYETNFGWSFGRFNQYLLIGANGVWGLVALTIPIEANVWYGIGVTRPAASNITTYYRFRLDTQTMASEAKDQTANGYNDGAVTGSIGAKFLAGVAAEFWDGNIARVGIDMGVEHTQSELISFFNGDATPTWDSRWNLPTLTDTGTAGATLTNVGTTTTDDPPVIGASPAIAMQRQGGQMIGRRYV